MQRECNDVAFGELILNTRLNIKENDTSKVQNEKMSSKGATLELVDVDNLLHKRVLPSQTST